MSDTSVALDNQVQVSTQPNVSDSEITVSGDEMIDSMNARLNNYVDQALGFGFFEGEAKQQLVATGSALFTPHYKLAHHSTKHSSSTSHALQLRQMVHSSKLPVAFEQRLQYSGKNSKEKITAVLLVTRTIAKRSIPAPTYENLLPVARNEHLDDHRWIVEQYGNELCTTEYYGAYAQITMTWNRGSSISSAQLLSELESAVTEGTQEVSRATKTTNIELSCQIQMEGIVFRDFISATTLSAIKEFVRSIRTLPIQCAVPLHTETTRIKNCLGFPANVRVERIIRDDATIERLTKLRHKLEKSGHADSAVHGFVGYLTEKIEEATHDNRSLLPPLRKLVSDVAQVLVKHGELVQLYERGDELRVHTENTNDIGVTASASEMLMGLTVGLTAPAVRYYQYRLFEVAKPWTLPEHYTTKEKARTLAFMGYYDRVKFELHFNDDTLVEAWREQLDSWLPADMA